MIRMASIDTIPALRRYIKAAIDANATMRHALRLYRADGGRCRTEDFATLWRDELRKREGEAA